MFGSSNRQVIHSRYRKPKKRVPKGVIIFLIGLALGASGLWFIETNYGPKRLSASESKEILVQNQSLTNTLKDTQLALNKLQNNLSSLEVKNQQLLDQTTLQKNQLEQTQKNLELFKQALPKKAQDYAIHAAQASYTAESIEYRLFISKNNPQNATELFLEVTLQSRSQSGRYYYADLTDKTPLIIDNISEITRVAHYKNGHTPVALTLKLKNLKTNKTYSTYTVRF